MSTKDQRPLHSDEPASEQGQKAYSDIIRSTIDDVNNILQSKSIFLVINIAILILILIMGRVMIHFIEPVKTPEIPKEFISEQKQKREKWFNPYQFSKYNNGIFLFGNLYSSPGSRDESTSYTLYMGTVLDKNSLKSITHYTITTPKGDFQLPASTSTFGKLGGDISAEDASGCHDDKCYVRVYVNDPSADLPRGIYTIEGLNGDTSVFKNSEVISGRQKQKALYSNPVDYEVSQISPGKMRIDLLSSPDTELLRVEVHSVNQKNVQRMDYDIFWHTDFPVIVPFDTSSKSLKIFVTEMNDVFNNKPTRRFKVIGNYPHL